MSYHSKPTAILAEDEPVLRQELRQALSQLWPDLIIVGEAKDGIAAAQLLGDTDPDMAFLDVQMPGMTGIEVARLAAQKSHVVFLTAFDDYAVKAFEPRRGRLFIEASRFEPSGDLHTTTKNKTSPATG